MTRRCCHLRRFLPVTVLSDGLDRVVSGVLTLSPGRYALGCLNHLEERLEIIAAIPRNPVGKILKKALREDIKKKLGAV